MIRVSQSHRSHGPQEHPHDRPCGRKFASPGDNRNAWRGYNIYVVEDCCGATSPAAQEAALSRMVQAGAVRLTTIGALLEWQRDWAKREHYDALMGILKQQGGAYGVGVEYAYTMVHHAPQSAQKPKSCEEGARRIKQCSPMSAGGFNVARAVFCADCGACEPLCRRIPPRRRKRRLLL